MKIVSNIDKAIIVMRDAAQWMIDNDKKVTKWWSLDNLNKEFLFQYAKPEEFYVGMVGDKPAVAAILQIEQNAQDWKDISDKPALYVHWLCVTRDFASKGASKQMIDFAENLARKDGINFLRADTDADNPQLRKVYKKLGFSLVTILEEDYRNTAFYQKEI